MDGFEMKIDELEFMSGLSYLSGAAPEAAPSIRMLRTLIHFE